MIDLLSAAIGLGCLLSTVHSHTTEICIAVSEDQTVLIAASTYHTTATVIGDALLTINGETTRYDFTGWVDDSDTGTGPHECQEDGVECVCSYCSCSLGNSNHHWQTVSVSGLDPGTYAVSTTSDSQTETPCCTFTDTVTVYFPPTPSPTLSPTKEPTAPTLTPSAEPTVSPTTGTPTTASPTTASPTIEATAYDSSYRWVVAGNPYISHWTGYETSECVSDSSNSANSGLSAYHGANISVQCCEMDGSSAVRPDCSAVPATYDDAVQLCSDYGYRLCTKEEAYSASNNADYTTSIGYSLGCQFSKAYNWVSDECTPNTTILSSSSSSAHSTDVGASFTAHSLSHVSVSVNTDSWSMRLSVKDMVILALAAINIAIVVAMCVFCKGKHSEYKVVRVGGDSEFESDEVQKLRE